MLKRTITVLLLCAAVGVSVCGVAAAETGGSGLKIPRFVSLAADEVNVRTGPGIRYPIRLVIRKEGLPVEIIREFDVWRQVREQDGSEGWVHKSMLSGRRAVIVRGTVQTLLNAPREDAGPVAKVEPGVIAALESCAQGWCRIRIARYRGWIGEGKLWGVYPGETVEE